MKLLLDENLSPRLVQRLAAKGVYAQHIAHVGRAGLADIEVWRLAFAQDQIVVTQNAGDFLELASDCEVHPGLIVFRVGGLTADEQWRFLEPVLDQVVASQLDLMNQVVEVVAANEFSIREIPPGDACPRVA